MEPGWNPIPPGLPFFIRPVQIGDSSVLLPRSCPAMEPIVIPLKDRRVLMAERLDLLGHAAGAVGLGAAAVDSLAARPLLGVAELALAAVLVVAVVREARHEPAADEAPAPVSWLNLVAAAVLLVEWTLERGAGGKLFSPELLSAVVTGGLAFLHPLIQRRRLERRCLRMDDTHLTLSMGRFRRYRFAWSELAGVETAPGGVRFRMADGTTRGVRMRVVVNQAEIQDAMVAGVERMASAGTLAAGHAPRPADAP